MDAKTRDLALLAALSFFCTGIAWIWGDDGWWAGAASGGLGPCTSWRERIEIDPRGACWSGRGPCLGAVAVGPLQA